MSSLTLGILSFDIRFSTMIPLVVVGGDYNCTRVIFRHITHKFLGVAFSRLIEVFGTPSWHQLDQVT